jgi:hypothetical protein
MLEQVAAAFQRDVTLLGIQRVEKVLHKTWIQQRSGEKM